MLIGRVARGKRASRRTVWREPASTRPPKPTGAASPERLQRAVGIEHLNAGAGPRVDVVKRLMDCRLHGEASIRARGASSNALGGCGLVQDTESDGTRAKSFARSAHRCRIGPAIIATPHPPWPRGPGLARETDLRNIPGSKRAVKKVLRFNGRAAKLRV